LNDKLNKVRLLSSCDVCWLIEVSAYKVVFCSPDVKTSTQRNLERLLTVLGKTLIAGTGLQETGSGTLLPWLVPQSICSCVLGKMATPFTDETIMLFL